MQFFMVNLIFIFIFMSFQLIFLINQIKNKKIKKEKKYERE